MTTVDPISLAIARRAAAERTRLSRCAAAREALLAAGFHSLARDLFEDCGRWLADARAEVSRLIDRLSDGSDEPRYAAAMTARGALGRLWEVM